MGFAWWVPDELRNAALEKVDGLSPAEGQIVIDEWAGCMAAELIDISPPNATCVTGQRLAHALRCLSGRVTTQRSAVVTGPHSVPKCEWRGEFFYTRPNAGRITASLLNKKYVFSHDTAVRPVYTGRTFWFYPRPLRQSGNQGTVGS